MTGKRVCYWGSLFFPSLRSITVITTLNRHRQPLNRQKVIYGSMDQEARRLNLEAFRKRLVPILIVTDLAARGIDIPLLDHVVNYSFPPNPKLFVHRVGRTARQVGDNTTHLLSTHSNVLYGSSVISFLGTSFVAISFC